MNMYESTKVVLGSRARSALVAGLAIATLGISSLSMSGCAIRSNPQTGNIEASQAQAQKSFSPKESQIEKDTTTQVLIDAPEVSASDIVKIVKHGDHWHVFTRDGREIITYKDPTKAKHAGDLKNTHSVVSVAALRRVGSEVVRILKHGDHYHVFTADGREFITYSDPSSLYPHLKIGTYHGSHGHISRGSAPLGSMDAPQGVPQGLSIVRVVSFAQIQQLPITKILKHGDHYHCYTADGTEYVTYENPQAAFPTLQIGTYVGNHGDPQQGNPQGSQVGPQYTPSNDSSRIVRVLRHGDHWHCYTADGSEFIYYGDAPSAFPEASVGNYSGPEHGGDTHPSTPSEGGTSHHQDGLIKVEKGLDGIRNKNIVKILRHGDHWHVYDSDGKEYVVHTDPTPLFPHATTGDYDKKVPDTVVVDKDELFTYDDVKAENKVKPEDMPFGDLRYMRAFDAETQHFYAWHLAGNPHVHAHTIEDIIRMMKYDKKLYEQKGITAKDVVATLKYYLEHPEAQPINDEYKAEYKNIKPNFYKEKVAVSAIKDKDAYSVFYWVTFTDGSCERMSTSGFMGLSNHESIKVTDLSREGERTEQTAEAKKQAICKRLGVSEDDFDDAWLELDKASSIFNLKVNDDGTAEYYGKKVDFLKAKVAEKKAQAQKSAKKPEADNAQGSSPAPVSTHSTQDAPSSVQDTQRDTAAPEGTHATEDTKVVSHNA